jgi:hypothetical protein
MKPKYEGPIEPGMVMVAPGSDGEPFRRDLVLGLHPFKPDLVLLEALPCKMRERSGSGIGEIFGCPEVNLRIVSDPE